MPRDIARGIASVKRFVRQHNIKGVHGTLIELIECSNRLHTAIEVHALAATLCLQCSARKTSPAPVLCPCTQLPLSWKAATSQIRHEGSAGTRCPGICIHDGYTEEQHVHACPSLVPARIQHCSRKRKPSEAHSLPSSLKGEQDEILAGAIP